MITRLIVETPAAPRLLVPTARLLAERPDLDPTVAEALLLAASETVCLWCDVAPDQAGRRTFLRETARIEVEGIAPGPGPLLLPWRIPVGTVTAITLDGTALAETDWRVEPMAALLWRLSETGRPCVWEGDRLTLDLSVGWDPDDVPPALAEACLTLARRAADDRGRDDALRSWRYGEIQESYWAPDTLEAGLLTALAPWRGGAVV
jgi:hypothetical protein